MLRTRRRLILAYLLAADALATLGAFLAAYYGAGRALERLPGVRVVLPLREYLWVPFAAVPLWWALFAVAGAYRLDRIGSLRQTLRDLLKPMLVGTLVIGFAIFVLKEKEFARRVIGAFLLLNYCLVAAGRRLVAGIERRIGPLRRLLLVGSPARARALAATLLGREDGLEVVGVVSPAPPDGGRPPILARPGELPGLLEREVVDDVVIADAPDGLEGVNAVLRACEAVGVDAHIAGGLFDAPASHLRLTRLHPVPLLTFTRGPHDPVLLGLKRGLDVAVAGAVLGFFWPAFLALAAAVRLTSRGPAFYSQERVGLNGRRFRLYKFRSMVVGADGRRGALADRNIMDGPVFKVPDDPRVTPLGRLMRRYCLDELPQFWNVLRGDMSLVGPRPPLPEEVPAYERWQRRRLSMRPGLTGLWQVSGRHEMSFEEWVACDLRYIDTWSLWGDLALLLRTLPVALSGKGL